MFKCEICQSKDNVDFFKGTCTVCQEAGWVNIVRDFGLIVYNNIKTGKYKQIGQLVHMRRY